jgi:hypothetical protein
MARAIIAIGFDSDDKPINIYTGDDFDEAQRQIIAQGEAGAIAIGHIYKFPHAARRFFFDYARQAPPAEEPAADPGDEPSVKAKSKNKQV